MTIYLDCNATAPVTDSVARTIMHYIAVEYGNSGSRTHEFGLSAKRAVEKARKQVADVIGAEKSDVFFTSGATESNNLAILGLQKHAKKHNKTHIITSLIEHKAVLEPIAHLEENGFDVTYLAPDLNGIISEESLLNALREDTILVSLMHINNETGTIQKIKNYCDVLEGHDAFFHIDAAQSFGKYSDELNNSRIDMISISAHKVYGPKGVGALIAKKRGFTKLPLEPLMYGGGQEKGLRPGTLPVALIAGFGEASHEAMIKKDERISICKKIKEELMTCFEPFNVNINGSNAADHVLNISIPGTNSEALMVALKGIVAISNGSACTSQSYEASHVLVAMGLDEERIDSAVRISWCHMTNNIPYQEIQNKIRGLL